MHIANLGDYIHQMNYTTSRCQNDYQYFAFPWLQFKVKQFKRKNVLFTEKGHGELRGFARTMIPLDDNFEWHLSSWIVSPFSHVYKTVEEFVLRCHENGIIEHFIDIIFIDDTKIIPEDPRKPLTMHMLIAGFLVWISCVALVWLVFIGEHIWFFLKNHDMKKYSRTFRKFFVKTYRTTRDKTVKVLEGNGKTKENKRCVQNNTRNRKGNLTEHRQKN